MWQEEDCSAANGTSGNPSECLADLFPWVETTIGAGRYYLLNHYNPSYFGVSTNAYTNTNSANTPFTIPPTNQKGLANILTGAVGPTSDQYCNICNPFQYSTYVVSNPSSRAHLQDTANLYSAIASGNLPAVSYVKPSGWVAGHPASSKLDLFEGFVQKIVDTVENSPTLAGNTVIFITFDEGRRLL